MIRNAYDPNTFPFNTAALTLMTTPPLPEQIEAHRDRMWRRDEDLESVPGAIATGSCQERRPPSCKFRYLIAMRSCLGVE